MSAQMKFSGIVLEGSKKASLLGFPTANLSVPNVVSGIYAGTVELRGGTYPAAFFGDTARGLLEAHLIGFSGNIYGEHATCTLYKKLREHATFTDDDSLKKQIALDVEETVRYFKNPPSN
jgi:riboflavin kinase / FMN adenylyltransferase